MLLGYTDATLSSISEEGGCLARVPLVSCVSGSPFVFSSSEGPLVEAKKSSLTLAPGTQTRCDTDVQEVRLALFSRIVLTLSLSSKLGNVAQP